MSDNRHLPAFNGWRAVAILMVMACHVGFLKGIPPKYGYLTGRLIDGNLGVRIFFTISGFLITWLLVKEEKRAGIVSLKNFYIRRALRILPVYATYLGVLAGLQMNGIVRQPGVIWLQLLTFTRNFYRSQIADHVSGHFWSLSIEEQFYLVWPVAFALLGGLTRRRSILLVCVILFSFAWKLIALLGWYDRRWSFLFVELSTGLYLDSLAFGCLGAILLDARREELKNFFEKYWVWISAFSLFLIVVPEIAGLGTGAEDCGFAILLLQSVMFPNCGPFKILNQGWLEKIGVLSYSLYIWHQLVFLLWPSAKWWFLAYPVTFAIAWLSYNCLERPFISLRKKFRAVSGDERKAI